MTNFNTWIENNYNYLNLVSIKIDKENGEEVLHFVVDKFLQKDHQFLDRLPDDQKMKYIVQTIKIQCRSKSSQYYREVKKFSLLSKDVILIEVADEEEETTIKELKLFFIEEQLKKINWFSSLMFKRWVETNCSAQTLADQLLIPLSTVQYHLRKVKNQIKNEWNKIDINKIM
jgi:hypothetical protein